MTRWRKLRETWACRRQLFTKEFCEYVQIRRVNIVYISVGTFSRSVGLRHRRATYSQTIHLLTAGRKSPSSSQRHNFPSSSRLETSGLRLGPRGPFLFFCF